MTAFKGNRVVHEYVQTNPATPEKVFPLLCPVREGDWLPGWEYRLIYSDSGVAERGCVFTTPNRPAAEPGSPPIETTWMVTEYDPAGLRISYVWIVPGRIITELRIQLTAGVGEETRTSIRYCYTGLSPEGNQELAGYDRRWFESKMRNWETCINHYLRTGQKMELAAVQ